jgi:predicted nucleic acid-binding protein
VVGCFDSDVLIDYFDGIAAAAAELARYQDVLISRITWMEVLIGAPTAALSEVRENFLHQFPIIELDENVARTAIALRRKHRVKIPDAIIWASARVNNVLLVTRNSKDFDPNDPSIRIPYHLGPEIPRGTDHGDFDR